MVERVKDAPGFISAETLSDLEDHRKFVVLRYTFVCIGVCVSTYAFTGVFLAAERHVIFDRTLVRGNRKAIMKIGWKAMLTKKLRAQLQSSKRIEQAKRPVFLKHQKMKFFCCKQNDKIDVKWAFLLWSVRTAIMHNQDEIWKYKAIRKNSKKYSIEINIICCLWKESVWCSWTCSWT